MAQIFATRADRSGSTHVLGRADIVPTARLLAQAFQDNPCYRFMHPRQRSWRQDLTAFFVRDLGWRLGLGLTWIARGADGEPLGTATLQPPGGVVSGSLRLLLSHWVWPTLAEQGLHTLTRIARAEREFSHHQRVAAGQPAYWLVHAVAVRPDLQRRGLGSALMRTLLAEMRMRAGDARVPLVLATQREANLGFYAQLGFRPCHQAMLGRTLRTAGFCSWFMRHEPVASATAALGGTNS